MKGDKPQPTELKILRMTSAKAKKLIAKITPTPGPLEEAPDWMTADQKKAWGYAIENAPKGVLKKIDKSILAGFIVAEEIHRIAATELAAKLLIKTSPLQGVLPQPNPYMFIVNRQMMLMMRAASELGFTPCSRARIDAGKPAQPVMGGDWEDVG